MKNECSVVRDILPLYLEGMVSAETEEFVAEHLQNCPECSLELEALKSGTGAGSDKTESDFRDNRDNMDNIEAEVIKSMKAVRKRFRRTAYRVAAVISGIFIIICILLHFFPVYRILILGPTASYYSGEQIAKALSIGSQSDRREAMAVLRLADKAFGDVQHTSAENEESYGLLSRYSTDTDRYGDAAFNNHSLELWSAHLGKDEGVIWVYYSSEAFNHDGSIAHGSWDIPSLWEVKRNSEGEWEVVRIREHP